MIKPLQAKRNLGVIFFPAFDWAITPTHPERQERLLYTRDQLEEEGLFDIPGIREYRSRFATHEQIQRAHFLLPGPEAVTTDSHLAAAGGAIAAARLVLSGKEDRAFAMVRPPGHHATRVVHGNRGFCNINNEAVMIEYIRDNFPGKDNRPLRVAIVDTDVHHGDGTQDIYWNDPHTLFISLHQDGRTLYPGTGFLEECGGPGALGKTINIPLPPNTSDSGYLLAMRKAVLPILEDFKPDLIINSAGQDNHFTDPLANMKLTAKGYADLTKLLNPDIAVLEGGYSIRGALPYVNLAICLALAGMSESDEIREPAWNDDTSRQNPEINAYIERLCDEVLKIYFSPPVTPTEGHRDGNKWTRSRQVFYDTDMLRENRRENWRLCDECSGLYSVETSSSRVKPTLCVHIPRYACAKCAQAGRELVREANEAAKFSDIKLLDGANILRDDAAKNKEHFFQE